MITARDICPNCSHLWDDHTVQRAPQVPWPQPWLSESDGSCGCCVRMGRKVDEYNEEGR